MANKMAKRGQLFLDGDSDEDSINTTTTEESERDDEREYGVEKILAEDLDKEGKVVYLLKWEGYPLHACQWERTENITSDILIRDWKKEKLAIKRGEVKPFDLTQFLEAVERFGEEKDEKMRRRTAKRRKRGEVVQSTEEGEVTDDFESHALPRSPKRTKVKAPPLKRKGVALPVTKSRSKVISLDTDDEADEASTSSEELIAKQPQTKTKPITKPSQLSAKETRTAAARTAPKSAAKKPTLESEPAFSNPTVTKASEAHAPTPPTTSSTAARKSVSSAASKPATQKPAPTSKVFSGDWTVDKKTSRQRTRVSGETPKDSNEPKFVDLSTQNRYQKYGKNEPTPDLDALQIIDPKTGRAEPAKATQPTAVQSPLVQIPVVQPPTAAKQGPADIHSAYGRRTRTPPPTCKVITKSPPTPAGQHPPLPTRATQQLGIDTNQVVPSSELPTTATNSAGIPLKQIMCKYWQAGVCNLTADRCPYAHAHAPNIIYSKKQTTCYYWKKNGSCKFGDDQCEFAHCDTGVEAGRPGTFNRRRSSAPGIANVRALQAGAGDSSPSDAQVFFDATEQPVESPQIPAYISKESEDVFRKIVVGELAPANVVTQSVTSLTNDASNGSIHTSTVPDPQVTNKTLSNETAAVSPAKDPRLRHPSAAVAPEPILDQPATEDPRTEMDRSVEADLEMAKKYITTLDSSWLLRDSGGQIENVYIHMPSDRKGELDVLRRYFQKHFNCRVYFQPNEYDHWKHFRETFVEQSCLLVFHPSETFVDTIPGLHKYLMSKGNKARVVSIGVQHGQCIREMREPAYEARRLFPNGGIIFITDDVFVYYPEKATEIIEAFLKDNEMKPVGAQSIKIGARPGIKDWMARIAMSKFEEDGGEGQCTDMRWVQCYDALCRLCPIEDEDPDFPDHSVPLETSHLWSVWEESLPSFKGLWEKGDEEGATDYMANHFAGEAWDKAWQYRKFFFVYQRPGMEKEITDSQGAKVVEADVDPRGWMKKYCHIGVVTPEQALKSLKK